jgi:DNA-binding CsgD family transcriptional regulator
MPAREIMLNAASDVDKICLPLKKLGIDFYGLARIYSDGKRIDLNTNASAAKYAYYDTDYYQYYSCESNARELGNQIIFGPTIKDDPTLAMLKEKFNINNMIIFTYEYEHYSEVVSISHHQDQVTAFNCYLANLDYLQQFLYYFKDKARHIIEAFEQCPLETSLLLTNSTVNKEEQDQLQPLDIDRYYFNDNGDYLTKRELECLNFLACGKSAEEVAMILGISKRTVEFHLNQTKKKFNCYKQTQIIAMASKLSLLDKRI